MAGNDSVVVFEDDEVFYERCAGIDVQSGLFTVCLRIGRKSDVREFGTTTGEIRRLVAWLKEFGCQMDRYGEYRFVLEAAVQHF